MILTLSILTPLLMSQLGSNTAIEFDGHTAYGIFSSGNPPVEGSTWEAWIRVPDVDSTTEVSGVIVGRYASYNHRALLVVDQDSAPAITGHSPANSGCGVINPTVDNVIPSPDWMHLAIVYFGQEFEFYLNGVHQFSSNIGCTRSYGTSRMYLGAFYYTGLEGFFNGEIDELRISNNQRYTNNFTPQRTFTNDSNTWGLWHFDDGVGAQALDSSGNNRHWDLQGNYSWVAGNDPNLDPLGDEDLDGMTNGDEETAGTDPYDQDTDNDGIGDNDEYLGSTDPLNIDSDGDGIQDGTESGLTSGWIGDPTNNIAGTDTSVFIPDADPTTFTEPTISDTDGGDLNDGQEDLNRNGAIDGEDTDPNDSLDDHFSFSVLGLAPGQQATLSSWDCRKYSMVVPAYSLHGPGPTPLSLGFDLDLTLPITRLIGTSTGNTTHTYQAIYIPPFAPSGRTIWMQAVEIYGGDNYRTSTALQLQIQ